MLAFKETLQDARMYFDEAAEQSKKSLVADDPMQTKSRRSTLNFPIEETDRSAAKSNSVYRYQKTSLSFRLDNKRPKTLLVSSNAGNILEAERFKNFQRREDDLKFSKYHVSVQSPTLDRPFDIFSPLPGDERKNLSGLEDTQEQHPIKGPKNCKGGDGAVLPLLKLKSNDAVVLDDEFPKNVQVKKSKLCAIF
jgi:hypothetical protein